MSLGMKIILIACPVILLLLVISDATIYRAALGLLMILVGTYLVGEQETLRQQVTAYRKELDRVNRICEELDQNTKIIVQTDLELSRTQEALDKKVSGLYALHELSKRILSVRSVAELSRLITEAAVTTLGFEKALLAITHPDAGGQPPVVAHSGFEPEEANRLNLPQLVETLRAPIFEPGEPIFASDVDSPPKKDKGASRMIQTIGTLVGARSLAIVPLFLEDKPRGFLLAGTNPPYPKLETGDVELMTILISEVGVAIENLELYEALKRSYDELEERVKARTQELAKANEELVRLNKLKSDFVSAVSHELRTPLTSIKGYAALVRGGKMGPVTKEQSERLEKINRHTDYLSNLISDLLDIARIESGRVGMVVRGVSLSRLIETAIDLLGPQLKEKDLGLQVQCPPELPNIQVDESRLQRVLVNLLSNAIKFTPLKGTVVIRATPLDAFLQVDVSDNGIGIPPEDIPKLFSEFFRADNPINRERKGTGLGLVLVKKIVEAHGGQIWVNSQVDKGTTFSFTIPWQPVVQTAMGIP